MSLAKTLALEPFGWVRTQRRLTEVAAPEAANSLNLTLVTSVQDLAQLEPEWQALWDGADGACRIFLSFNWVWHWCQQYLDSNGAGLAIVTGRRNGQLVIVWPLVLETSLGARMVSFLGAPVSQYGDVLVDRCEPQHQEWLDESWAFIKAHLAPDIAHLRKVRDDSAVAPLLGRAGAKSTNHQLAPFITLSGEADFETFDECHSARDRKNRRRKRKRLGEQGSVGFRRSRGEPAATMAFKQAMAWKRSWLKEGVRSSTALSNLRFDQFFAAVLGDPVRRIGAEVFELTLDGKSIATKVAMTCGAYRGMYFTAYDKAHEKCSPGSLLVEEMIAEGLADGITTLDFMAPAYDYKMEWASGTMAVADYSLPLSAVGGLYHGIYVQQLRPRLQKLAARGPIPLRRLMSGAVKLMGGNG